MHPRHRPATDRRGHGRSSGKRGHIGSFRDYREDLDAARIAAAALAPDRPLFLVAHSNGSLISLAALTDAVPFACVGAVLSSPFLGLRLTAADYASILGGVADFLDEERRGLRKFIAIIKSRNL